MNAAAASERYSSPTGPVSAISFPFSQERGRWKSASRTFDRWDRILSSWIFAELER